MKNRSLQVDPHSWHKRAVKHRMSIFRSTTRLARAACAGAILFAGLSSSAGAAEIDFDSWLAAFRTEALGRGISPATLASSFENVEPIPRVIELDRKQPEFTLTWDQYYAKVVNDLRVQRGRELLAQHRAVLTEIGAKYGVQPRFVVALWGIETDFGRITGGFNVIPALATLAYDGRRATYFRGELIAALTIIERGHVGPREMKGSWAGAMGQPQFMPSTFLNFAVDYNGDGRADIWRTPVDIFASAANYLAKSGWRDDLTWGRAVSAQALVDRGQYGLGVSRPLSDWQTLGIQRREGTTLPKRPINASLIEAEANGPTFLVYENYRVLLKWNRSTFFALAVGHLADRIGSE